MEEEEEREEVGGRKTGWEGIRPHALGGGGAREENGEKKGRESEKELVKDAESVMTKGRTIK